MKATELIKRLQELVEEHGDGEVETEDEERFLHDIEDIYFESIIATIVIR